MYRKPPRSQVDSKVECADTNALLRQSELRISAQAEYERAERELAVLRETVERQSKQMEMDSIIYNKNLQQHDMLKRVLTDRQGEIARLKEQLREKEQELCLARLQNRAKKVQTCFKGVGNEAQRLCVETLFELDQMIQRAQRIQ